MRQLSRLNIEMQRWVLVASISLIAGLGAAGISLLLPNQYTAKGLLIVTRKADTSSTQFFTYEGYYAQQNAQTYATTFLSILQSPNNLKSADKAGDVKKLSKLVKAKKNGLLTITVNVKGKSAKQAQEFWNNVVNSALNTHEKIVSESDPLVQIIKTPNSPVVVNTYPQWQTIFAAGFLFSCVLIISLRIIYRYLKEDL